MLVYQLWRQQHERCARHDDRHGRVIKPHCGSSNPHNFVARPHRHSTRRGFLHGGFYDACPHRSAASCTVVALGRRPTTLNHKSHLGQRANFLVRTTAMENLPNRCAPRFWTDPCCWKGMLAMVFAVSRLLLPHWFCCSADGSPLLAAQRVGSVSLLIILLGILPIWWF